MSIILTLYAYSLKMKLLIKFPTRSRPEKCLSTLQKYIDYAEGELHFLITLDENDETITPSFLETLSHIPNCTTILGQSKSKIHACNRDMKFAPAFDILLLASDDMIPIVKGYDRIIRENMQRLYPDTDGVLWFNDGFRRTALNTLCILGRKYYDRFGYIYHPDYKSFYCDNEFTEVATFLEKQTYFNTVIIRHDHPFNTHETPDALYLHNDTYAEEDKIRWIARRNRRYPRKTPDYYIMKNGFQVILRYYDQESHVA